MPWDDISGHELPVRKGAWRRFVDYAFSKVPDKIIMRLLWTGKLFNPVLASMWVYLAIVLCIVLLSFLAYLFDGKL